MCEPLRATTHRDGEVQRRYSNRDDPERREVEADVRRRDDGLRVPPERGSRPSCRPSRPHHQPGLSGVLERLVSCRLEGARMGRAPESGDRGEDRGSAQAARKRSGRGHHRNGLRPRRRAHRRRSPGTNPRGPAGNPRAAGPILGADEVGHRGGVREPRGG